MSTVGANELYARMDSERLALPAPGPDMDWSLLPHHPDGDTSKLTVTIHLVSVDNGFIVRRARIAVDLYGWKAVTERCRSMLESALDERYAT